MHSSSGEGDAREQTRVLLHADRWFLMSCSSLFVGHGVQMVVLFIARVRPINFLPLSPTTTRLIVAN